MDLLADEALPRRLRHLDGLLAAERDELAEARERVAGMPERAPDGTPQQRAAEIVARGRLRQRIEVLLLHISFLATYRVEVLARLRALGAESSSKRLQKGGF